MPPARFARVRLRTLYGRGKRADTEESGAALRNFRHLQSGGDDASYQPGGSFLTIVIWRSSTSR